ncbi:MAG: glycosyltransferase family 2 protein [Sandaracinaceae bacterium]|nr:glycosyltransferase family 2 protein [Sandaracinaceae bacterium]
MASPPVRVSVLMPVRDAGDTVVDALESVLATPHVPLEVVVVDDGSRDATRERVLGVASRDPRVRLLTGEGHGITAALNQGLRACEGEFIARMDADDLAHVERLGAQLDRFLQDPGERLGRPRHARGGVRRHPHRRVSALPELAEQLAHARGARTRPVHRRAALPPERDAAQEHAAGAGRLPRRGFRRGLRPVRAAAPRRPLAREAAGCAAAVATSRPADHVHGPAPQPRAHAHAEGGAPRGAAGEVPLACSAAAGPVGRGARRAAVRACPDRRGSARRGVRGRGPEEDRAHGAGRARAADGGAAPGARPCGGRRGIRRCPRAHPRPLAGPRLRGGRRLLLRGVSALPPRAAHKKSGPPKRAAFLRKGGLPR